jgi:predicted HTH transcriptional regulator
MTRRINDFLKALIEEPVIVHKRPISELIHLGESDTLEFKSSIQWDIRQDKQNTDLRHEVLKTIVAFLNSGGGTLVIGVEDNGNIYGLHNDIKLMGGTLDEIQKLLSSIIMERIGPEFSPFIKLRFEQLNGDNVCVVDVDRVNEPAYVRTSTSPEFYIRFAATSKKLDVDKAIEYVEAYW